MAAILILHKCTDLSPLESSKEGLVLKAILTKNFALYLDNREPKSGCYLKYMKEYEALLSNIQPYIKTKLHSKKLSEYFWYQVFLGNLDKVQNLNTSDSDILFYLQMLNDKTLESRIKSLNLQSNDKKSTTSSLGTLDKSKFPSSIDKLSIPSGDHLETRKPSGIHSGSLSSVHTTESFSQGTSNIPMYSNASISTQSVPTPQPAYQSAPKPIFKTPSSSQSSVLPSTHSFNQQSGMFNSSYQQGIPSIPTAHSHSIHTMPSVPGSLSSGSHSQSALRTPYQSFNAPPKSPFSGPIPINPLKGSMAPTPKPISPIPPFSSMDSSNKGSQTNPSTIKPSSPIMNVQNVSSRSKEALSVENPQTVLSTFDQLVADVRQKAALNNSIILKHRKNQFLNALNGYETIDKNNIPSSVLYAIDLVSKRIEANGNNLKPDLTVLVEGYSDVVWLKAFVELVKMVY